mmetsp:Transcript_94417/g.249641  ORF Transcript_94417/g.249641 Transcript_94417/m.249641 type:complete len:235 (+) Transcript_94417:1724-2428(+)
MQTCSLKMAESPRSSHSRTPAVWYAPALRWTRVKPPKEIAMKPGSPMSSIQSPSSQAAATKTSPGCFRETTSALRSLEARTLTGAWNVISHSEGASFTSAASSTILPASMSNTGCMFWTSSMPRSRASLELFEIHVGRASAARETEGEDRPEEKAAAAQQPSVASNVRAIHMLAAAVGLGGHAPWEAALPCGKIGVYPSARSWSASVCAATACGLCGTAIQCGRRKTGREEGRC